jgi:hypothetical protein
MKTLTLVLVLIAGTAYGQATDYNSSPYNYKNSPYNYENSEYNYRNSPYNYDNSPMKYGNDRIIRDESGNARGYVVPKPDGGANIFDLQGNRQGYVPGRE